MTIFVRVRNNDVNGALKILKRKMIDDGLLRDLKKHEFYRSKAQKKRDKHKEAMKRVNKTKRLQEEFERNGGKVIKDKKKKIDALRQNNSAAV